MESPNQTDRILELRRYSASERIAALQAPLSSEQREHLRRMIALEALEYRTALELLCRRQMEAGRAKVSNLQSRLERLRTRTIELEQTVRNFAADYSSVSRCLLYLLAFLAAVATEYAFNASALAYIMSLRRGTLLATVVAFAVAMSVLALEEPLRKLIAEPAEQGKALKARAGLLIAVGIINLVSLGLLGEARAQGLLIQQSANVQEASAIPILILVITLVVALNGALFWQVGRAEAARLWQQYKARRAWARAQRCEEQTAEQLRHAEAEVVLLEAEAGDEEGRTRVAEHLREEKELELALAEDRIRVRPASYKVLVDDALAGAAAMRLI